MSNKINTNNLKKIVNSFIFGITCLTPSKYLNPTVDKGLLPIVVLSIKPQMNIQKQIRILGEWNGTMSDDVIRIRLKSNQIDGTSNVEFNLHELVPDLKQESKSFTIGRDAGTLNLKGIVKEGKLSGTFIFESNKGFDQNIIKFGININNNDRFSFFLINVRNELLATLQKKKLTKVSRSELSLLAMLDIDSDYINFLEKSGINNLTIQDIISAKSAKVDETNIDRITLNDDRRDFASSTIQDQRIYNNTSISGHEDTLGSVFKNAPSKRIKSKFSDTPILLNEKIGSDELLLKDLKITLKFVNDLKNMGYLNVPTQTLVMLNLSGISVKYIDSFTKLGYKHQDLDVFVSLKNLDVDAYQISAYDKLGSGIISLRQMVYLKLNKVTPEYVLKMRKKGYTYSDLNSYVSLIH